jgi:hypothetical protein
MTRLLLSVLFYTMVTPLAVVLGLLGRRPMPLAADKRVDSYFQPVRGDAAPMTRQA